MSICPGHVLASRKREVVNSRNGTTLILNIIDKHYRYQCDGNKDVLGGRLSPGCALTRQKTSAPTYLEVVTSGRTIQIQHLPGHKKISQQS